jgi:hypothetical protein
VSKKQIEKAAKKKARVLSMLTLNGVTYQPNQLIEADEQTINALVGQVDPHPDAVAYIEGLK